MRIPTARELSDYISLTPAQRREVNKNPRAFLLFFAYYNSEYIKYPFAQFHADFAQDLVDLLNGTITKLVWCTARDTAKTSFAQKFLIMCIVNEWVKYPNVDSYDRDNSERFLFEVVIDLQTNRKLIEDYGQLFNSTVSRADEKQQKRVGDFVTENGIRCEAHTTQESVRGRKHGEQRPDMNFFDDFETMKVARSEAALKEVSEHLSEFEQGMEQGSARMLFLCNWVSDTGNVATLFEQSKLNPMMRFRKIKRVGDDGLPTWPERDVLTDADLLLQGNAGKVSIESKYRSSLKPDTGDADWMREMQLQPVDPVGDGPDKMGYSALFPMSQFEKCIVNKPFQNAAPFATGVDPSGDGDDLTAIAQRSSFMARIISTEKKSTGKSIASLVVRTMEEIGTPDRSVVVDSFGVGFKCLQELSLLGHRVKAVNVGELEVCKVEGYLNDRAYMYFMLRDWLAQGGEILEYPGIRQEMRSIRFRIDEKGVRHILPKKEIKKRGFKSPDELDAVALSFLGTLIPIRKKKKDDSDFDRYAVI